MRQEHLRFAQWKSGFRIELNTKSSAAFPCPTWSYLRRAEIGHHHHIAGAYLLRYAQEASWREDNRRVSNGEQTRTVAHLAMKSGPSVDFSGYWQRHIKAA